MCNKMCWFCNNFWYINAQKDFSEDTPGNEFFLICQKDHWVFDAFKMSQLEFGCVLSTANDCKDFEEIVEIKTNDPVALTQSEIDSLRIVE